MDPVICVSATSYQSFPWPLESVVMQAAIHLASFSGADRSAKMHWPINTVASRKNLPFVFDRSRLVICRYHQRI